MSELLTGSCPNCGCKLSYSQSDSTVTCFACDSVLTFSEIAGNSGANAAAPAAHSLFMGFDDPESGIVFLENFFESYDWDAYQLLPEIAIPELAQVIGNNKIKNGAIPETWYLDFMSLYVPATKKLEGLGDLESKIINDFNPIDPTEIFAAFDNYRIVAEALLAEKESLLKSLNSAIDYAERFSLSKDRITEMKQCLQDLNQRYATINTETAAVNGQPKTVVVTKIENMRAYNTAKEKYATRAAADFAARDIDAKNVYAQAVKAYQDGKIAEALPLFETVRAYSDSAIYIQKLTQYFDFFGEVYRFGGKHFIYKQEDYSLEALNLKKLSRKEQKKAKKELAAQDSPAVVASALYEIVDGVPAEQPTVKGISGVITSYGTKLFYFKYGEGIACYDFTTHSEDLIDKGANELYLNENGEYELDEAQGAPIFYVKKRFSKDIKGCMGKKKGVKTDEINPYTLVVVDMAKKNATVAVDKMVEIRLRKGDKLFYSVLKKDALAKRAILGCLGKKDDKHHSHLMAYDLVAGKSYPVLDDDCEICDVVGDLVIYNLWTSYQYNKDLHIYNIKTGVDTLIENNIYDFYQVIDGKVYYTIGNAEFRPLVRANFDGSEREQIMLNVKKVEMVRGGWFYVTKGRGANSVLVKFKADGKDMRILCNNIKNIVRFDGNYIYYSDFQDNLRVVRIDGQGARVVAQKVTEIFPAEDGLYYCRSEQVSDNETDLSLYHMDKDGRNIRKIVFNVDKVVNDPISNMMYFSKNELIRYKVFKRGKEKKAHYEFFNITKYYSMKKAEAGKNAEAPVLYLTIGLPEHKKGCLAKLKKNYVYVEAPIPHSYKTRGMSDTAIMALEEEESNRKIPVWWLKSFENILPKTGVEKKTPQKGCAPKKG